MGAILHEIRQGLTHLVSRSDKEAVDVFVDAVRPAYQRARRSEAFVVHQPPGEHTFSLEAFEAMARFFARHLAESVP